LIKKSAKNDAVMIYMSATITEKYKQLIGNKKIEYHLISRRFHKKDLALPVFVRSDNYLCDKTYKIISDMYFLKKPLIIYVGSISKALELKTKLDEKNYNVDYITSETKYKKEVIKAFINEEIDILVSTTLLERGVTFKNINVIVLEADAEVFNEASLIQRAGRVGRIGDEGLVIFISKFKSLAMINAKKAIAEFNSSNI
jgi:competence protein ComFA